MLRYLPCTSVKQEDSSESLVKDKSWDFCWSLHEMQIIISVMWHLGYERPLLHGTYQNEKKTEPKVKLWLLADMSFKSAF